MSSSTARRTLVAALLALALAGGARTAGADTAHAACANPVANGGFESGTFGGWSRSGQGYIAVVTTAAHTGSYGAEISVGRGVQPGNLSASFVAGGCQAATIWSLSYKSVASASLTDTTTGVSLASAALAQTGGTWAPTVLSIPATVSPGDTLTLNVDNRYGAVFLDDASAS